jgi:hypothetical protein
MLTIIPGLEERLMTNSEDEVTIVAELVCVLYVDLIPFLDRIDIDSQGRIGRQGR